MLTALLDGLTRDQKTQLDQLGIKSNRRAEWKSGVRHPTAAQCMVLAMVTETDPQPLLAWLAEQEASPAQQAMFQAIKNGRSVKAAIALAVSLSAGGSHALGLYPSGFPADLARPVTMHIVD